MTRTQDLESKQAQENQVESWEEDFDKTFVFERDSDAGFDILLKYGENYNDVATDTDIKAFIREVRREAQLEVIEELKDGMKVPLDDGRWLNAFDIQALKQHLKQLFKLDP
ncbi:MAG: hypothetical protein AB1757_06870 [Acidobacteriota bacterium]